MQPKLTLKDAIILYSLSIYQLLYGKVMSYRTLKLLNRIGLDITPEDIEAAFKKSIKTGRIRFSEGTMVFVKNLSGDFSKVGNNIKFRIQQAIMQEWFEDSNALQSKPLNVNMLVNLKIEKEKSRRDYSERKYSN